MVDVLSTHRRWDRRCDGEYGSRDARYRTNVFLILCRAGAVDGTAAAGGVVSGDAVPHVKNSPQSRSITAIQS